MLLWLKNILKHLKRHGEIWNVKMLEGEGEFLNKLFGKINLRKINLNIMQHVNMLMKSVVLKE